MVTENRHLSLREIAAELSMFYIRLVPKDQNFLQKLNEYHRETTVFT